MFVACARKMLIEIRRTDAAHFSVHFIFKGMTFFCHFEPTQIKYFFYHTPMNDSIIFPSEEKIQVNIN